jgi:hypothetical protein
MISADLTAWLDQMFAANAKRDAEYRAAQPKLPPLTYRQRRAEWAAMGKTGDDAAQAMQGELDRRR